MNTSNRLEWKEKELEDYICLHPRSVGELIMPLSKGEDFYIMGRQISCQYGIIDLIAGNSKRICIIELKSVAAKDNSVGQLGRYREAAIQICERIATENMIVETGFMPEIDRYIGYTVIAPRFNDNALKALGHWGNPVVAEKTSDGFEFTNAHKLYNIKYQHREQDTEFSNLIRSWAKTPLENEKAIKAKAELEKTIDAANRRTLNVN